MHDAETAQRERTAGELASLAGVSVRTLHHYDEIGLLRPTGRTAAGHRRYGAADAERLQRILFYRALALPLDRIRELLDDPGVDAGDHLRRQLELVDSQLARLERVRSAILTALEADDMSIDLTPDERREIFGADDPAQHEAEAERRWGHTDAWQESRARASRYTADDWRAITAEQEAIEAGFAAALAAGAPADGERAMELAERARRAIDERFYPLSPEAHRGLADLYVSDPRFTAHYDRRAPGLAAYVHDAIHANADRTTEPG